MVGPRITITHSITQYPLIETTNLQIDISINLVNLVIKSHDSMTLDLQMGLRTITNIIEPQANCLCTPIPEIEI
jgi:hypothetical protein